MTDFEVSGPDGKKYKVNAPVGKTKQDAIAYVKKKYYSGEQPAGQEPSLGLDAAKGFGRGVAHGVEDVVGLPGDIAQTQEGLIDYGADWLGIDKDSMVRKGAKIAGQALNPLAAHGAPTSAQVRKAEERVTGGLGKSETWAGELAEKIGEQVPTSIVGPGGRLLKASGAVLGGVGSYLGKKATEGTGYEGVGETVGGLAGGGLAGANMESSVAKAAAKRLGDKTVVKDASQAAYKLIENAPYPIVTTSQTGHVTITPSKFIPGAEQIQLRNDIAHDLYNNQHIDQFAAPKTYARLGAELGTRQMTMADLLGLHQRLGRIEYVVGEGADYMAAMSAREEIRNWIEGLGYGKQMKEALGNWSIQAKIGELEKSQEIAAHRAAVSGTGSNEQNTMRQEIRKILDSDARIRGYPPAVRAQMERIVNGTLLANSARWVGRFAPTGLHSSAFVVIAAQLWSAPLAAGAAGTGYFAKKLGDYLTHKEIEHLTTVLLENAPVNKAVAQYNQQMRALAKESKRASAARGAVGGYLSGSADEVLDNPSGVPLQ